MLKNKLLSAMGGAPANYIEDVFSTYLYTGNGSTQTITNGIDLAGKGGLVWLKPRNAPDNHVLWDTSRGATKGLISNNTDAEFTQASGLTSFGSTGFTVGTGQSLSSTTYASWTFRKQPKFFDVVTYTGDDNFSGRQIAHNLGSVPGCILIKKTSGAKDWEVWHRSLTDGAYVQLNSTAAQTGAGGFDYFGASATQTSTYFTLGDLNDDGVNRAGATYVAYLFAHNAGGFGLTGNDNVISCGSYVGNGSSTSGPVISLGYEPQFLLIKAASGGLAGSNNWQILDVMRGMDYSGSAVNLAANTAGTESFLTVRLNPSATGFQVQSASTGYNENGTTYIYIAIRRGPMKVPTLGTSVFKPQVITANGAINAGFPSDSTLTAVEESSRPWPSRLSGGKPVFTNNTNAESASSFYNYGFSQNSYDYTFGTGLASRATLYDLRRAPGFFDVVCYTGTGANTTVAHNLGVVPELMIIKGRSYVEDWAVYSASLANTQALRLNSASAFVTNSLYWNSTTPTASVFTVGTRVEVNNSGGSIVAYLFATCPGVSKVGSYTGNGSNQTINCGFTGGARFVMIKRADSTGDWYVWDTARGIVSGNDPHLSLNTTAAEVTSNDSVDTDSTGFVVNQLSATNINVTSATYIYLAIA